MPHKKATEWFETLYHDNKQNHDNIPWARQAVNPMLEDYLNEQKSQKGKALVIGCGLGDDAYALNLAGYDVLAIDVSQTALDLAQKRFSESTIRFEKQDIFEMPAKYHEHFDFVFEAFTIQSLPVAFREKMITAIAKTLKPSGKLLLVAHKREHDFDGPPWPLTQEEIDLFKMQGLTEIDFKEVHDPSPLSNTRFKVLYQKSV